MRPILFLDIDGVLNSMTWLSRRTELVIGHRTDDEVEAERALDPDAIRRLNVVIQKTNCLVVLSSSWRKLYPITVVERMLAYRGFEGHLFAATPSLRDWGKSPQRGGEIYWWLKSCWDVLPPFAIVDDDSDMEPFMSRLVQTSNEHGLQDEHVERLVALLKVGASEDQCKVCCAAKAVPGTDRCVNHRLDELIVGTAQLSATLRDEKDRLRKALEWIAEFPVGTTEHAEKLNSIVRHAKRTLGVSDDPFAGLEEKP